MENMHTTNMHTFVHACKCELEKPPFLLFDGNRTRHLHVKSFSLFLSLICQTKEENSQKRLLQQSYYIAICLHISEPIGKIIICDSI